MVPRAREQKESRVSSGWPWKFKRVPSDAKGVGIEADVFYGFLHFTRWGRVEEKRVLVSD